MSKIKYQEFNKYGVLIKEVGKVSPTKTPRPKINYPVKSKQIEMNENGNR